MVTFFKQKSSQKQGEIFIIFAFGRQYISLVTVLKKKRARRTLCWILYLSRQPRKYAYDSSKVPTPFFKGMLMFCFFCLVLFLLILTKGHLLSFQMDLMPFFTYKMEMLPIVILSLPYEAVWGFNEIVYRTLKKVWPTGCQQQILILTVTTPPPPKGASEAHT